MKPTCFPTLVSVLVLSSLAARANEDLSSLCADRAAVERVYYQHRTGEKPPFEEVLPADVIRHSIERDLLCEAALRRTYGVEITKAELDAELKRIEANTRAPKILTELKRALDNDPARFARAVVRPTFVERELRAHFENDDALHAQARRQCEDIRRRCLDLRSRHGDIREMIALLKHSTSGQVAEHAWDLGRRSHAAGQEGRTHFEDLSPQLRQVLAAQLCQPGDVSAVIETADQFLLFVVTAKTSTELNTTAPSVPKLNLEAWLNEQRQ